jgi:D-aminopeptidase
VKLPQAVVLRLPYRSIIHVAGINMFWRASEKSIRGSVRNAIRLVNELAQLDTNAKVVIVEFQKKR